MRRLGAFTTNAVGGSMKKHTVYRLRSIGTTVIPHDTGIESDLWWEGASRSEAERQARLAVEEGVRRVELWVFEAQTPFDPALGVKAWTKGSRRMSFERTASGKSKGKTDILGGLAGSMKTPKFRSTNKNPGSRIRNSDGSLRLNVGDVVRRSKDTPKQDGSLPTEFSPMTGVVVKVYPDIGSGAGATIGKPTGKVRVRWASGSEATHDGHFIYTVESIKARGIAGLGKLPKKGRIPLATAKRALARLPAKVRACGFTVAQLREGMEVEREHRSTTKGGVLATAKIAAAHLCEFPRGGYYPGLKRLERKLKRGR